MNNNSFDLKEIQEAAINLGIEVIRAHRSILQSH